MLPSVECDGSLRPRELGNSAVNRVSSRDEFLRFEEFVVGHSFSQTTTGSMLMLISLPLVRMCGEFWNLCFFSSPIRRRRRRRSFGAVMRRCYLGGARFFSLASVRSFAFATDVHIPWENLPNRRKLVSFSLSINMAAVCYWRMHSNGIQSCCSPFLFRSVPNFRTYFFRSIRSCARS